MNFVGIDPGLQGAIAVIDGEGRFQEVVDMPVITTRRKEIDFVTLWPILSRIIADARFVVLEKVGGLPKQSAPAAFNFGAGWGFLRAALIASQVRHDLISPQRWKKSILEGGFKDKGASRECARRHFPDAHDHLNLKKHHGRAEALLMAEYGRRMLG